jgi:hypothetical protein
MKLPSLARDIHILTCNEEIAHLTPLHVAIHFKQLDLVKFILTHM